MADKKKSGWSLKGTIRKFFSRTDIPVKATAAPGNTVRTKNITYMSGPSTWKSRVKNHGNTNTLVPSPQGTDTLDFVIRQNGSAPQPQPNGSLLVVSNGTIEKQNGRPLPNPPGGRKVNHHDMASSSSTMSTTPSRVQFAPTVTQNGVERTDLPPTLPKPNKGKSKKSKLKDRETYRNYVFINETNQQQPNDIYPPPPPPPQQDFSSASQIQIPADPPQPQVHIAGSSTYIAQSKSNNQKVLFFNVFAMMSSACS